MGTLMAMSADDLGTFAAKDDPKLKKAELGKLAALLERSGISIEDIHKVNKVNAWQGFYKDKEGDSHLVDLVGIQLSPVWAEGPAWPVVQQAKPCVVRHGRSSRNPCTNAKVTVLLPDTQTGYRRDVQTGELTPMHDELAMAAALELLSVIRPHRVVHMGDGMDFAEWSSRFLVLPEFVLTTQPTLDREHRWLAECQAAAGPQCEDWAYLEGNHDDRLMKAIARNAMAAMRLRQANVPESWPVMSVPHLLRLEELGIGYVDGYPAGRLKLADKHGSQAPLYALHGERTSMERQAKAERVSTVQGHAHHFSMHTETYDNGDGPVEVEAWSIGSLCRRDGAVPSTRGAAGNRGKHIERTERWQHGIAVVVEDEDGWDLLPVRIHDGRARWGNTVVKAPAVL